MNVVTLTGNLLAEWTFDIVSMLPGTTHRAESMSFQVGGKGVNVCRILGRLGTQSEAIGFAGGTLSRHCSEWLDGKGIRHVFFPLEDSVRPGVVIRETASEVPETTFLGKDAPVSKQSWSEACNHAKGCSANWMAICGSIPGWQADWKHTLEDLHESSTLLAVDSYGPPLQDLVEIPIDLVKINRKELDSLLPGKTELETIDLLRCAVGIFPVRNWIITDGPRPMVAYFQPSTLYTIKPASVTEVSAMGSGDTFLAALLSKWGPASNPEEALKFACACATGNAASPGIGDFPLPPLEAYYPDIRIMNH